MPTGTPSDTEMHTETRPASSEARAPQMTRDSTSRPISSVPNRWAAVGALRMAPQLVASGSCGAIQGAKHATRMNSAMNASPTMAPLRRRSCNSGRRQVSTLAPHPGADDELRQVRQQVEQDV